MSKTTLDLSMLGAMIFLAVSALTGCAASSHPTQTAQLGKVSNSALMEQYIDQPGPIELTTINSANWSVPLSGMINLDNPVAKAAHLTEHEEPIHIYAHVLTHPTFGTYLVDTGVSQQLADDPSKAGVSWWVAQFLNVEKLKIQTSTRQIVQNNNHTLSGVFFTHLHIDHISGMPNIADDVPLYIGKSENTEKSFMNLFTYSTTNHLFEHKQPFQEWNFAADTAHQFEGVIDIFGDASVFAISVPGHTPGSVAYLVRTTTGPVLLVGDTSHTRWGWENSVEPGTFTGDQAENRASLLKLIALVKRHPQIAVRFGHQD